MSSQTVGAAYIMAAGQDASFEVVRGNGFNIRIEGFDIELFAYSCNVPEMTNDTGKVYHGNESSNYALARQYSDVRCELYDYIAQTTVQDLWTWYKQVQRADTGQIGFANEYKRNVTIEQVDSKGDTIRTWYIAGCVPKRGPTPSEDLAYDKYECIKVSLNFSVDWMSLDGFNRNSGIGSLA